MNKPKSLSIALVAASLVTAGCAMSSAAQETVTVKEDIKTESMLTDQTLAFTHEQTFDTEFFTEEFYSFHGTSTFFSDGNKMIRVDTETGNHTEVSDKPFFKVSRDGKMALSIEDELLFLADLESGEDTLIGTLGEEGLIDQPYFSGGESHLIINPASYYTDGKIEVIDTATTETSEWIMDSRFVADSIHPQNFQVSESDLLLTGKLKDGAYGIYRLAKGGDPELLLELALDQDKDSFHEYVLLDQKIIFNGMMDGQSGIFIKDLQTDEIEMLVSGGKTEEGIWTPSFNLSPDCQYLLFDTAIQMGSEFYSNVYVGRLDDLQLTHTSLVMEHADSYAVISYSGYWTEDSQQFYVQTYEPDSPENKKVELFRLGH
ncbi:hypothetical protein [Jeotgalibacillus sp. R-1-5s-1]|uniref:hypothetical protein n=1 Tax=Jeotgalibacillus sp. R-1-5s-1 TaxID=2555897 RepID=UPI00106ADB51|nr:hypothetical protein [Jeotgalibacillus sp. R-1-5s-1]TFD94479.1 hypothetical protein E2491_13680 [Jeotgalibacillus sp. R-1-5s-1]